MYISLGRSLRRFEFSSPYVPYFMQTMPPASYRSLLYILYFLFVFCLADGEHGMDSIDESWQCVSETATKQTPSKLLAELQ